MPLAPGTQLGPYEITASLGAGGMGEVYRARDTRLERTVAIKILPSHLSNDSVRKQRFEREAKTISSLNHPHICTLHDIGSQDGIDYLVMECVEGETLAKRLQKGPLPLEQVLKYGAQIADALDKAHRAGIVHRDLKPGNIMLTATGAKLLDFGLAKPVVAPMSGMTLTATTPVTQEGTIVGTYPYMSPEQVEGKELDGRSDIFSLGAVLYEMVTGKRAFEGKTVASTVAAILAVEPKAISTIQPMSPRLLERTVKACLEKDPANRWQSAGDLATALAWIKDSLDADRSGDIRLTTRGAKWRSGLLWGAIVIPILGLALSTVAYLRQKRPPASVIRFSFAPPERTSMGTFMAYAPDGNAVAFVATNTDGKDQIWLRRLNAATAELLSGTEGASFLFWSPDGRYVGFFADRKLKIVPVSGGPARALCDVLDGRGASWGSQNIIVFSAHWQGGLERIPASGGEVLPATTVEQGQDSHRMPTFLPDGKHFVYYASGTDSARSGLYLGSLDGKQGTRLRDADSSAGYADPGLLVFVQDGRLLAQALDERSLRLTGDAISLAESIIYDVDFPQSSAFAVSRSGNIAFRSTPVRGNELVWFDRRGKRLGTLAHAGDYAEPALSHDGRYVAVQRGRDVILISVATGASSRLVGSSYGPTWSPDDKRIIFSHIERGGSDIFLKEISDSGNPKLLVHSTATKNMDDWSQDGRYIAWGNTDLQSQTKPDVYIMQLDGGHQPIPFLSTPFDEASARFSPDGKWIVYTSDESGRDEVYVQPFPKGGDKLPVSIGGGREPYWRGDGREIFYLSADRKLMAVAVQTTGSKLEAGSPTMLFRTIVPSLIDARSHYVPAADGQRFLVVADLPENQSAPVNVVLNFPAEPNR